MRKAIIGAPFSASASVLKTDSIAYGNLLKLSENKCFRLNNLPRSARLLLIFVDLGCFNRYKFDYSGSWPDGNLARVNLPKTPAGSTGRCNTGLQFTRRGFKAQGLSRALIEAQSYLVEIGLRVAGQVRFLREVLS